MAAQSITVNNGVTVEGALLAITGAVTLENDTINAPQIYVAPEVVPYHIQHYFENSAGSDQFTIDDSKTQELTDEIGATVTASPLDSSTITGFTYDSTHPSTVITATIAEDGSTVLRLYYTKVSDFTDDGNTDTDDGNTNTATENTDTNNESTDIGIQETGDNTQNLIIATLLVLLICSGVITLTIVLKRKNDLNKK